MSRLALFAVVPTLQFVSRAMLIVAPGVEFPRSISSIAVQKDDIGAAFLSPTSLD